MESIAMAAIRYGGRRTRGLLLEPPDWKFLLAGGKKEDSRRVELRRLRAYYRGTRLLARLAVLLILPTFILPFTVPFIGFDAYLLVVAVYAFILIAFGAACTALGLCLDAIWGLQFEEGTEFVDTLKMLINYSFANPGEAVLYTGSKLFIDMILVTMVLSLFMPALIALIGLLLYLLHAIQAGDPGVWSGASLRLLAVAGLALAAVLAVAVLSKPMAAFYGYYTEEAVRRMRGGQDG